MVMLTYCWVAVAPAASVTWTVNVVCPVAVGVPVSWPLVLSDRPAGGAPTETIQLKGVVPVAPVDRFTVVKSRLTVQFGSVVVAIVGVGLIVMLTYCWVAVAAAASVAW